MNHSDEETMKKTSVVNLDKLLDDFSEIEKVGEETRNIIKYLRKFCKQNNVIKGLTQTIENQCNVKGKGKKCYFNILHSQEYKDEIEKLMMEIKNKEEDHKLEITQLHCDIRKKFEVKEMEYKEQQEKKELEILELTRQLKIQNEEKQNEIIKLQIEVCIKKMKPLPALLQKLQHLQEEKNKEIEILRNTIRDLEQRLNKGQDLPFKRRRF
uniref:Coiled-coil domain containing 152 n=1 Tax=Cyanoderma ruficeps TaxID=181631 RepID=A0A8C3QUF1_9PASS